jgi:cold shock CspA family protein
MKGTITAIIAGKGYGFIRDEQGQDRVFHARSTADFDKLREGMTVAFEPWSVPKAEKNNGLRARDVVQA